jgi:hypothetical protein
VKFVQIIEYRSSRFDEMQKVAAEWEAAGSDAGPGRVVICADRDDPGRYLNIVFFDSYEQAMENSAKAETGEFAQRMMALADGPPTFHNLDVVDERL